MAVPLTSLAIFAKQRPSTLVFVSEILRHTADDSPSGSDLAGGSKPVSDLLKSPANLLWSIWTLGRQGLGKIIPWPSSSTALRESIALPCSLLETKYGLRLELYNKGASKTPSIRARPSHTEPCKPPAKTYNDHLVTPAKLPIPKDASSKKIAEAKAGRSPKIRHRYRLFPDWQTSYLWYDSRAPLSSPDEPHVDEDVIEGRYPTLAPFYFEWQDIFNTAFERQECHLGSGKPVFSESHQRVAWETEGFLIACFLALQDDVEEVEYQASGTYRVERMTLEGEWGRFLSDMETLLREPT